MARNNPTIGKNSPIVVRANHDALEQAVVPASNPAVRQSLYGKRWLINGRQTVTTAESALYIYIENPTNDRYLHIEGIDLHTDQSLLIDLHDEPTLDETTFNSVEFKNTRSSVKKNPPWNLYRGVESAVTVSDTGRTFIESAADPGSKKDIGTDFHGPGYIVDPNSSTLISLTLDSQNDTTISFNSYCHEGVTAPDLTDLDGTN